MGHQYIKFLCHSVCNKTHNGKKNTYNPTTTPIFNSDISTSNFLSSYQLPLDSRQGYTKENVSHKISTGRRET